MLQSRTAPARRGAKHKSYRSSPEEAFMAHSARGLLAFILCAFAALPAGAQNYPSKPVHIIVPFAAGGPADIYARFVGQKLQESLGQAFVIEDRPGGGSLIGTEAVAKSPPDGYTLLMMSNTHTVNESLIPK